MVGPPLEVIQCLVQMWLESIQLPQGKGKSASYVDQSESGNHKFDGLQALALDLVCLDVSSKQRAHPLPELLLLLTNEVPPLHFACAHTWIPTRLTTIQYLSLIYPNDQMWFHDGKLPFHNLCSAGVPHCFLEWWLGQCPNAILVPTTDTGDFPLHCYLSSKTITATTTTEMELFTKTQQTLSDLSTATVFYLAKQYPAAMCSSNGSGWLLLHMVAMHDAPLDMLVYLVRAFPKSIM